MFSSQTQKTFSGFPKTFSGEVCVSAHRTPNLTTLFYRSPPSLYHLQKLQKHRTNSVRKLNRDFLEKRENRPSGIRFTGVPPPSTIYKNSKNIERTLI